MAKKYKSLADEAEEDINTFMTMYNRAKKYGLQDEVTEAFLRHLNSGDSVASAARAALYDWDC